MSDVGPRVLVIDDDALIIDTIRDSLDEYGIAMTATQDPTVALALAHSYGPDLILSDVVMPEMTGYDVLRALRADPELAHIPLVLMTGVTEMQDRMQAVESGADDLLSKPFDEAELISRIKALLRLKARDDEIRRANAQLQERTYLLSSLFLIAGRLHDSMLPGEVFSVIRRTLESILGAQSFAVYAREVDAEVFQLVIQQGVSDAPLQLAYDAFPELLVSAMESGRPALYDGVHRNVPVIWADQPVRAVVPLSTREQVVGLVVIHEFSAERSDGADFEVVTMLSSQVAGAIHNLHLHSRLEQYSRRVEETSETLEAKSQELEQQVFHLHTLMLFSTRLHSTVDLDEVHAAIRDLMVNFVGVAHYRLVFFDQEERYVRDGYADGYESISGLSRDWTALEEEVIEGGDPVFESSDGLLAMLPLLLNGKPKGVLLIDALLDHKACLTHNDRELLALLAHEAAIALFAAHSHERQQARKRDFYAMLAHDFRGPLGTQQLALSMLRDEALRTLDDFQKECLQAVQISNYAVMGLVEDFMAYSRIQAGAFELACARTDLVDLVRQTSQEMLPIVQSCEQTLDLMLPDEPIHLELDSHLVRRVLANLLSNATKYTGVGGEICVRVERQDGGGLVQVRDTGRGIPAEEIPRLFTRYHRVRLEEDNKKGTGLGLVVVKEVVEAHGGKVWVESAGVAGQGSTFSFYLPHDTSGMDCAEGSDE